MGEKTLFVKFFGDSPKIRVLDMLITGRDFEYCIKDIAEQANVGRTTFYRMLDWLIKNKIIQSTKRIGRIQLYKINKENPNIKALIEMYDHLLNTISNKEIEKQRKLEKLLIC